MRIQKSCVDNNTVAIGPVFPEPKSIKSGTIFRYNSLDCGPYLKVNGGIIDFKNNYYTSDSALPAKLNNYVELKDAYLVTGEK